MSFGETNIQNEWLISKIVEVTEINSYLREERSNWILEYDNLMSRFKQTISYVSEVEEKAQNLSKDNEMLSSELKGSNLKLEQATRTITELQGLLDSRSGQDDLFKMQQEQISARESELKAKVEELTLKYANALKDSHSESESHAETVKNLEQKIKDLEKTEGLISEKLDVIA
jgi:chromosome segregation ATPase